MDCKDVQKFVYVYLDNEFDDSDRVEFEAHLDHCPECRQAVCQERQFKKLVKKSVKPLCCPLSLKKSIQKGLHSAEPRPTLYARAYRATPAMAIAMVITFLFWPTSNAFTPIVEDSVKAHQRDLPNDVSGSGEAISRFLKPRVRFNVALPLRTGKQTRLLGARLSYFRNRKAVLYHYMHRGRRLTVVQFVGGGDSLPQATSDHVAGSQIHYQVRRGYTVGVYRHRGVIHSVIGTLNPSEMRQLIPISATGR